MTPTTRHIAPGLVATRVCQWTEQPAPWVRYVHEGWVVEYEGEHLGALVFTEQQGGQFAGSRCSSAAYAGGREVYRHYRRTFHRAAWALLGHAALGPKIAL